MKIKLKTLLQQMLQSPLRFPVEAALGLVFFIIAVLRMESVKWTGNFINDDIIFLFIPLMALSFWLQRVNKKIYYASFLLFMPLMALDLNSFLWTYGFGFTYILAAILLIAGNKRMDNRSFAAHALHVTAQMFFGLLVTGIFNIAVIAIISSFLYIFEIEFSKYTTVYVYLFIWIVLAPQICCTFIRKDEDQVNEPAKLLQLILNYILSPAVMIYTVILYAYFIKIVFEWELPKGGVAWMVMGFITVALAGRMAQSILSNRYYDWLYRHFTLIAIPPLILYWIGSLYRIKTYSFTESRFYLMVAGVLMTLYVLMMFKERTRRYQLMVLIFGAAIILFTYIPGISAKSIGLRCQKERLVEFFDKLQILDAKTGKLIENIDLESINKDSLLVDKYSDLCSVIDYVKKEIGTEEFQKNYGEWKYTSNEFFYEKPIANRDFSSITFTTVNRTEQIEMGGYSILLPSQDLGCYFKDGKVKVENSNGDVVLECPIDSILQSDTTSLQNPKKLLTYKNDSLMLIIDELNIVNNSISTVYNNRFLLFKKSGKN